uniref:NADH dehydrogenase subunit 6 n=1 Tax=Lasius spathepus TaxID=67765 RepID=A0A7S7BHC3_9HYME|nr:NADH dehydrogenase subunit 6 [Lasius spathepus]QOW83459.1 NADH dehydrogenase subunit 6 [Lasius spathepus]
MNKQQILMNLLMIMMLISIMYFLMTNIMHMHPIIIMIILLSYSFLICLNMSTWKSNYIYSIMLFLIMISGMLIIFLYFSSLISNEQNIFKFNKLLFMSFYLNLLILSTLIYYYNSNIHIFKYMFTEIKSTPKLNKMFFQNILNLYEYPINNLTISSMMYLLISLFTIIKICSLKSMSLRKIK